MFERNELYILIDKKGLEREALFSGSDIVEEIVKRGSIIKPVEVNSFGDVHAFMFGTGGFQRIEYIPREFVKYFDMLVPVAVETRNIVPFPKRPKVEKTATPLDGWDKLRTEIEFRGIRNSLVRAKRSSRLPTEQFSYPGLNLNHMHLEARAS